jgi:hypothetical protein
VLSAKDLGYYLGKAVDEADWSKVREDRDTVGNICFWF